MSRLTDAQIADASAEINRVMRRPSTRTYVTVLPDGRMVFSNAPSPTETLFAAAAAVAVACYLRGRK